MTKKNTWVILLPVCQNIAIGYVKYYKDSVAKKKKETN